MASPFCQWEFLQRMFLPLMWIIIHHQSSVLQLLLQPSVKSLRGASFRS